MTDYNILVGRALDKRDRIIDREGDLEGFRRSPLYLKSLVEDEIKMEIARERCNENSQK